MTFYHRPRRDTELEGSAAESARCPKCGDWIAFATDGMGLVIETCPTCSRRLRAQLAVAGHIRRVNQERTAVLIRTIAASLGLGKAGSGRYCRGCFTEFEKRTTAGRYPKLCPTCRQPARSA